MNEGHLVDVFGQVRKDRRDGLATFALRLEFERRLHQIPDGVLKESRRVFELWIEFADALPVPLAQLGFEVPGINLTGPPINEEPDNAFGFARKMRVDGSQR